MVNLAYTSEEGLLQYFLEELSYTLKIFGKIDGILIHQGEADNGRSGHYEGAFHELMKKVRGLSKAPIYLSQVSYCNNDIDSTLLSIQQSLITSNAFVLRGVNSDTLGDKYRYDSCHFNRDGLKKLADLWVDALIKKSEF